MADMKKLISSLVDMNMGSSKIHLQKGELYQVPSEIQATAANATSTATATIITTAATVVANKE
jgi:hypothetical protein